MKRSLALLGVMLAALLAMGATKTVRNVPTQVVEVCLSGACKYSTIASALAAITDSSSSKRYTVEIGPGTYDETITAVSYVTLKGESASSTILSYSASGSKVTVSIPDTVTEFRLQNLSVDESGSDFAVGTTTTVPSTPRTLYITDCVIGGVNSSSDAVVDQGGKTTWFTHGNIFQGHSDVIRITGADITWYGDSNFYNAPTQNSFSNQGIFNIGSNVNAATGFRIYESNSTAKFGVASSSRDVTFFLVNVSGTATDTQSTIVDMSNVNIEVDQTTNTAGNPNEGCFKLNALPTMLVSSPAPIMRLSNVNCRVTSADASGTGFGLWVVNDADFANWDISWNGGRINVTGAGTNHGIRNLQAGTTVNYRALSNNGTNTATGPILVGDSADLTAGTCLRGQTFVDTGGATVEWCVCGTTGTWGCWELSGGTAGTFNQNGPKD